MEDLPKTLFSAITKQRKRILEFKEKVFQIWYSHFHIKGHKESHRSSIYQLLALHKVCKRTTAISLHNTYMIVGVVYPFMNLYGERRRRVAWLKVLTENDIIMYQILPFSQNKTKTMGKVNLTVNRNLRAFL